MRTSQRTPHIAGALLALLLLAGCASHAAAKNSAADSLLGTWFDNKTGAEYQFIGGSVLVTPHPQTGGGNAVTYRIVDGDKLDVVSGGSHHVSLIANVTTQTLTLADPISGLQQRLFRDVTQTQHIKSVETSALVAASQFATITTDPTIIWATHKPTGKGAEWTNWAPDTLTAYGTAWDWTTLKRAKIPALTSGGGDGMGFSFAFQRKIPTPKQLEGLKKDTTIEATAGLRYIDVGYSASKAKYPAGTMVYLPGGLIYSLGDGYAIGVTFDRKTQSFVPLTHK